jgi:hypothetical protein
VPLQTAVLVDVGDGSHLCATCTADYPDDFATTWFSTPAHA